jgi:hypothetical protein
MNVFPGYFVRRSYDYGIRRLFDENGCPVCSGLPYIRHSPILRGKRAVPQHVSILSSYYGLVYALRVLQSRVLRTFTPKRAEVIRGWRKLHIGELHNVYSSLNIIRMIKTWSMRWAGHIARWLVKSNTYRVLVGEPEGKRPLGRHSRRRDDNIKMDLR